MKLTRISRLQDCGVFRNFSWPGEGLLDFKRYNLIYGWNGTGKTTLSRLLRDLELKRSPTLGNVVLRIDGSNIRGENFAHSDVQVRVFNRDFIQENVFPVQERNMPPILVLGAENVEKQKSAESLKKQLSKTEEELKSAQKTKQDTKKRFDEFCRDRAKVIKDTLRVGGQGRYNNYDKSDFKTDAENMAKASDGTNHRLADTERDQLFLQHRATLKPKVNEVAYAFPNFSTIKKNVSELLTTTVVSEVIEALKTDAQLANWTRQGLALHQDRDAKLCQFCGQKLPESRIPTLEKHFSDQYERFIQQIDQEITKLKEASRASATLDLPAKAQLYDDLGSEYQSQEITLKQALKLAKDFTDAVAKILQDKKSRVFEQVSLEYQVPEVNIDAVERLNKVIQNHNQACDSFENTVKEARKKLANDMIAADLEEFIKHKDAVKHTTDDTKVKQQKVDDFNNKILKLEQEIVEHRRPAEELNGDLQKYLGHSELYLEIKNTGYTLTRGGTSALNLSEGETTAIALLYFLKSLQDRRFDFSQGIVVLDDPVSSLDSNTLFFAFSFIREQTEGVSQIILLTHNFSFFRQVRNWFYHLKGQNKRKKEERPARFYMLDFVSEKDVRSSTIQRLDPLLEDYNSEYHYLFARIYRASNGWSSSNLEQNYVFPNMARRMLETFLAFRLPQISGLQKQLNEIPFDESRKRRILRFLHTHSHSTALGEPEHDLSALNEGPSVLKDLMDMIESEDPRHFSAMRNLANQLTEPDTAS